MSNNKAERRIRAIMASLDGQGCVVQEKQRGWFVKFPNGDTMTVHKTESDHRAEKNTRARVLRAGLKWPFDAESR